MNAPAPQSPFVERFESHLRATLHDPRHDERQPRVLLDASRHLAFAGSAKRMRPMLVDHFGAVAELPDWGRLSLATTAELVHTASLLHDDVVDAGTERRGRPTVNMQWNNSVAVLGGDLLLCIALEQLQELPREVTATAVELVAEMTRSAMLEVQARQDRSWALPEWEAIADGKTGALLAWCGTAPALAVGRPRLARQLADCGRHLGLAFQLCDDLHDLLGLQTGKDRFADLLNATPNFPLAAARSRDDEIRATIDAFWRDPSPDSPLLDEIARAIVELGLDEECRRHIDDHLDRALEALGDHATHTGGNQVALWTEQLRILARQTRDLS